jgi:phage terminase small subunit
MVKLTAKQSLFIDEYMVDKNATAAAVRAGYSKRSANNIGPANLLNPIIKGEIDKRLMKMSQDAGITAEYVLNGFKTIAERCMSDDNFDPSGANKSLEMLGKYLKLFTDNVNVSATVAVKIVDDVNE